MKHLEVKELFEDLKELVEYIKKNKIIHFHINYGLDRNEKLLRSAVESQEKNVNPEMKELEEKVWKLVDENRATIEVIAEKYRKQFKSLMDETLLNRRLNMIYFSEGEKLLSEEDKKKKEELYAEWIKSMQDESDVVLYNLNPEKCENAPLEYRQLQILAKFFPKD